MTFLRLPARYVLAAALFSPMLSLSAQATSSDQVSSSATPALPAYAQNSQQGSSISVTLPATQKASERARRIPTEQLWKHPGVGIFVGINGVGLEIVEPLGQHFNVRGSGEYMQYTGDFTSDGAQINAAFKVGGGTVSLDYYPWHNGFRISPLFRFANQTHLNGTVIVPAGQSISLDGGDYVSSASNPLHGSAEITTKSNAPGVTIGYGNLSPRHGAHFSFPVEVGFYYIGQPGLNVTFSGTACDPHQPPAIGCQDVVKDAGFQKDLTNFIARNNHNLSYAKFFPIAKVGFGYRF